MVRSLIVIGSGIAGLFATLTARRQGVHPRGARSAWVGRASSEMAA